MEWTQVTRKTDGVLQEAQGWGDAWGSIQWGGNDGTSGVWVKETRLSDSWDKVERE